MTPGWRRRGAAVVTLTLVVALLMTLVALPAGAQPLGDGVDEDGPAGPLIEGADSGSEVRAATAVTGDPDAHRDGVWTDPVEWPIGAIHAILLPDGKVMTYGTDRKGRDSKAFNYDIWDPSKGLTPSSHTTLPVRTSTNLFCSAQTVLSHSGQVLLTGGEESGFPAGVHNNAVNDVNLFDPASQSVTRLADSMSRARWYPTATALPNGEVLIHGGRDDKPAETPAIMPEVYQPGNGWRRLTGAASTAVYGSGRWFYPRSWVAPNGKVFIVTKGNRGMWYLDPRGKGSVARVGTYPGASTNKTTPAAMFDKGKVLITTLAGSASVIDINSGTPKVTRTSSLRSYRAWSDATVLADGDVLVTGGASVKQQLDKAVRYAEIWNPDTGNWRRGASAAKARLYHSTAILLPDATVLTVGGGPPGPVVNLNAEIYHPPYLFRKDGSGQLANRPTIAGIGNVGYGGSFTVDLGTDRTIAKVALVRTGSVTHSFDMDQRYIPLDFTQSGSRLTVDDPRNARIAPPGQYMVFAIAANGVPSKAKLLQLETSEPPSSSGVQVGRLTLANSKLGGRWISVVFPRRFTRTPVVTVGAPSGDGKDPVIPRVRNVTRTGFQLRLDEWDYLDGDHMLETVSYVAAEPGRHTVGGITIEAGAMTASDDVRRVRYSAKLPKAPVVLTQVASVNDASTVATRVRKAWKGSVRVSLQEQESSIRAGQRHGQETVHYIALTPGKGSLDGRAMRVKRMRVDVNHKWRTTRLKGSYRDATFAAAAMTTNGGDPATPRYRDLRTRRVDLRVQEEQSHDGETRHASERLGFVVVAAR